jgi:hypothetical protein
MCQHGPEHVASIQIYYSINKLLVFRILRLLEHLKLSLKYLSVAAFKCFNYLKMLNGLNTKMLEEH